MSATAELLRSLEAITHEATEMLGVLDEQRAGLSPSDAREAKRRAHEIRDRAQEFFDWLAEVRLEEPRN
jgi:hypothetical protein